MRALFLAGRRPPSHHGFLRLLLGVHREGKSNLSLPFLKRPPILWDLDPTLITSFYLNYPPKALSPNTVALGVRGSTCEFGRLISQSIATGKLLRQIDSSDSKSD